jgi:hypothetical protein
VVQNAAGADMVRLASDSGGCRVVEAFVESSANPKLKAKLMKKLKVRRQVDYCPID